VNSPLFGAFYRLASSKWALSCAALPDFSSFSLRAKSAVPFQGRQEAPKSINRRMPPAEDVQVHRADVGIWFLPDARRLPDHEDWMQRSKLLTMAREEFAENHSASQSDVDAVYAFAQANNLKIGPSNLVRRTVSLSGTIGHISGAFSVELNHYALDETKFRGRT
jgi:Pro-kumamolisin, activation domain